MIDSLQTGEEGGADPPEMSRFVRFFQAGCRER